MLATVLLLMLLNINAERVYKKRMPAENVKAHQSLGFLAVAFM